MRHAGSFASINFSFKLCFDTHQATTDVRFFLQLKIFAKIQQLIGVHLYTAESLIWLERKEIDERQEPHDTNTVLTVEGPHMIKILVSIALKIESVLFYFKIERIHCRKTIIMEHRPSTIWLIQRQTIELALACISIFIVCVAYLPLKDQHE